MELIGEASHDHKEGTTEQASKNAGQLLSAANGPRVSLPGNEASPEDTRKRMEKAVLRGFNTALREADLSKLHRAVWRIGELGIEAAVPDLISLIPSRDESMNYCAAWALGRCGDAQAYTALKKLYSTSDTDAVKWISLEAMLATASKDQYIGIILKIVRSMPRPVQAALKSGSAAQLATAAGNAVIQGGLQGMALLENLYRVAPYLAGVRPFVLSALRKIPFKTNYFRAVRHIYKAAEFKLDTEVIGLLALRFEVEKAGFHCTGDDYAVLPGTRRYVPVTNSTSKPDSKLDFTNQTRDYFRKRVWRMLRCLGDAGDRQYISLAMAIMLPISDDHATAPRESARYCRAVERDGHQLPVPEARRTCGPFGGFVALNHILHTNSIKYQLALNGVCWLMVSSAFEENNGPQYGARPPREEAFPELWDRQPQALWKLLTTSRCEPIHEFAARALIDNTTFCDHLAMDDIRMLLSQPYKATIELGLELAQKRYDPANPEFDLIKDLLQHPMAPAKTLAAKLMQQHQTSTGDLSPGVIRSLMKAVSAQQQDTEAQFR